MSFAICSCIYRAMKNWWFPFDCHRKGCFVHFFPRGIHCYNFPLESFCIPPLLKWLQQWPSLGHQKPRINHVSKNKQINCYINLLAWLSVTISIKYYAAFFKMLKHTGCNFCIFSSITNKKNNLHLIFLYCYYQQHMHCEHHPLQDVKVTTETLI